MNIRLTEHAAERMLERFGESGSAAFAHIERIMAEGNRLGPGKKPGTYWHQHPDGLVLMAEYGVVITVLDPDTPMFFSRGYWWSSERASDSSLLSLVERYARLKAR